MRACLWLPLLSLLAAPALGQVAVNQISFPRHIGRTLDAPVTLAYTRTSNAAAVIQTVLAPQVTPAALPAGCRAITVGGAPPAAPGPAATSASRSRRRRWARSAWWPRARGAPAPATPAPCRARASSW
jgi:hypothetical protein